MFAAYRTPSNSYRDVAVQTAMTDATPHRLIAMLYEGGLDAIGRARQALKTRDVRVRGEATTRAIRILEEGLTASLDDRAGELAARLRALRRRHAGDAQPQLVVGDLAIDPVAHQVTWQGAVVELGPREYAVLEELARAAGRVLSREQLEARLYEWDRALASNAIEVHVHHLRRKLAPQLIRTVRGVGYLMPHPGAGTTK